MDYISIILGEDAISDEVDSLAQHGIQMVDRFDSGSYTMVLLRNPDGTHEVALTSTDRPFTTPQSQLKSKPTTQQQLAGSIWTAIMAKFSEWLGKHGTLTVGTMNQPRSRRYHSLFKRMGFQVGDMDHVHTDNMEYWTFDVMSVTENCVDRF